ncbi:MAG: preprotein translocase subunit SecG [bacterium]|nr:preprotein translocase subunit SecG [bacterium]
MKIILPLLQIIISALLMVFILMQSKGTGLGSAWGGSGEFYRSRRGAEKLLFYATIVLVFLFALSSILGIIIHP